MALRRIWTALLLTMLHPKRLFCAVKAAMTAAFVRITLIRLVRLLSPSSGPQVLVAPYLFRDLAQEDIKIVLIQSAAP